eukprot:756888-Hanusia_phi.AAC.1
MRRSTQRRNEDSSETKGAGPGQGQGERAGAEQEQEQEENGVQVSPEVCLQGWRNDRRERRCCLPLVAESRILLQEEGEVSGREEGRMGGDEGRRGKGKEEFRDDIAQGAIASRDNGTNTDEIRANVKVAIR